MANVSIENRYWFEDSIGRAWPPGQDVFTGENNPKANYALDLNIDGQVMTFIPDSVINNGVYSPWTDTRISGKSYYLPWFLDQKNQQTLAEVGKKVDLSKSDVGGYVKDSMGASTSGFLVPKGSIPFDSKIVDRPGKVLGMGSIGGSTVYLNEDTNNQGKTYFTDSDGVQKVWAPGDSGGGLFGLGIGPDVSWVDFRDSLEAAGVVAGNYVLPGSSLVSSRLVSEGAQEQLATDEFRLANAAAGITGGMQGNMANYGKVGETLGMTSADPNAVGGVTGPDNIDVGGGWNPATGATAAELEAARLALDSQGATGLESLPSSVNTPEQAFGTGGTEVTADQITSDIAGNADKSALYSNAGYGDAMTSAQIDAYDKAIAAGLSVSDALNYARAGLLVNALVGDPLGLGGGQPEQAPAGSTGFAMVPIPAEWKSPTYAASSAPIDLSTIFSNQNMLGGTQWQGLPSQRNMSFNDIFASGQQQTPMGTPVDINQIVSSILGQAATSQKPA